MPTGIYKRTKKHRVAISIAKIGHVVSLETRKKIGKSNQKPRTHGKSRHHLYPIWRAMINRCHNKSNWAYKWYGGRGIKVLDRWKNINNFIEDVTPLWFPKSSMDRIDNNKGYDISNIRFVSHKENLNNMSRNVRLKYKSEEHTLSEWADLLKIKKGTLWARFKRKLPVEKILSTNLLNKK